MNPKIILLINESLNLISSSLSLMSELLSNIQLYILEVKLLTVFTNIYAVNEEVKIIK